MKQRVLLAVGTIVMAAIGLGCEDAARRPVQARNPASPAMATVLDPPTPARSKAAQKTQTPVALTPLPLTGNLSHRIEVLNEYAAPMDPRKRL